MKCARGDGLLFFLESLDQFAIDAVKEVLSAAAGGHVAAEIFDVPGAGTGSFPLLPLPEQRLLLSEVVVDPQFDWNDSQGARGLPFDGDAAPSAHPSPTDEWVELWNAGSGGRAGHRGE